MLQFNKNSTNRCQCKTPCKEIRFHKNIYALRLDRKGLKKITSKAYQKIFQKNLTDDIIDKSFYRLEIFFPKAEYYVEKEVAAYSIAQLYSDFGGQLGLAFGASALSIIELLVICILSIYSKESKRTQNVIDVVEAGK